MKYHSMEERLTSVPKLPSRSIPLIPYPIFLRRLQVPRARFEPLIHDNEGHTESSPREQHDVKLQPGVTMALEGRYVASEGHTCGRVLFCSLVPRTISSSSSACQAASKEVVYHEAQQMVQSWTVSHSRRLGLSVSLPVVVIL